MSQHEAAGGQDPGRMSRFFAHFSHLAPLFGLSIAHPHLSEGKSFHRPDPISDAVHRQELRDTLSLYNNQHNGQALPKEDVKDLAWMYDRRNDDKIVAAVVDGKRPGAEL